eukprot:CAMPEP_0183767086 /NCGR_PEP_ID=MMETSP0739-20130205/11972_1 /TAXON_ID=385413 /ORGANISM="Thalassiosira miniscula, Strain CCMP1093" /LENGTH=388 /DNA_ID=CAMNT_0026005955 /DNA_START=130 /DNA_END=1296 /DNA_ORIENTATION=+
MTLANIDHGWLAQINDTTQQHEFANLIDDLKSYKQKHGHINVMQHVDKRLYECCNSIRSARRNAVKPGHTKPDEECIAALDGIGFDWELDRIRQNYTRSTPFERRVEELKSYKEKHGHVNVKKSEDTSLYAFCHRIRSARKNPGKPGILKLDDRRIAVLDSIGFDWQPTPFERRVEELKSYKEKHGHINVKRNEDVALYRFCNKIRSARKNQGKPGCMRLDDERIAALDGIEFDWRLDCKQSASFECRLAGLTAYKAKHGHINVKQNEDKGLFEFCNLIRCELRSSDTSLVELNADRIANLDALGFDWGTSNEGELESFKVEKSGEEDESSEYIEEEVFIADEVNHPLSEEGDWVAYMDSSYGRVYYFNHVTGNTSWDPPTPTFPVPL